MKSLQNEVQANFSKFKIKWKAELDTAYDNLSKRDARYATSYRRLVSLQAWRTSVMQEVVSAEALAFFLEAQNDALLSHVLARLGSWRSALQSLRSCIENTLACLYYADHPVELELWLARSHRFTFSELFRYFETHPRIRDDANAKQDLQTLRSEYATLSLAVHGSAKGFRMTVDGGSTMLWSAEAQNLGRWLTREDSVIRSLNMLLLTLFASHLQGNRHLNLRKAISLAIPASQHTRIRRRLKVALLTP